MNRNISRIVNWGDRICASLELNGRRLASVNGVDFPNLDSVKNALLKLAGNFAGMAVITVRNCTQGWRDVTAIAIMRRPASMQQSGLAAAPRVGSQYLIPWAS